MNAITRTTSVAVFVTLGVALPAWAAEPPKPEPRKGDGAAGAASSPVVNYRGDRNGYFADCTPPTQWNGATGQNIRWKTPMPNWTYSTPIVVGTRVFTMSEPGWKSDFPELVCVDAETGKILWQREINHLRLSVPDEVRRKQVAEAWHNYLERFRLAYRMFGEAWTTNLKKDQTVQDALTAQAKSLGWFDEKKHTFFRSGYRGSYGPLRGWGDDKAPGVDPKYGLKVLKDLNPAGLSVDHWYGFGKAREGVTFPAPVSDGRHVYVSTIFCSHACFDLDGNLVWMDWRVPDMEFFKYTGLASKRRDFFCKSPLLVDGLFVSEVSGDIEARDAKTGTLLWNHKYLPGKNIHSTMAVSSSKVMDLDGVRVVVMSCGLVVRVSDGKVMLADFAAPGYPEVGTDDDRDLVVTHAKPDNSSSAPPPPPDEVLKLEPDSVSAPPLSPVEVLPVEADSVPRQPGLAAWRLVREGDTVRAVEVWRAAGVKGGNTMAVHAGKIYTGMHVVDIETGAVKNWGPAAFTRWQIAVAGDKVWGLIATSSSGGKMRGMPARNDIHKSIYSCPFTFAGSRIYLRSLDELICIGEH